MLTMKNKLSFTQNYKNFSNLLHYFWRQRLNTGVNMEAFMNKVNDKSTLEIQTINKKNLMVS